MTKPIAIHVLRTKWEHWGRHAGITRYLDFLDPSEFAIHDKPTPFEDERHATPRAIHDRLRGLVRSGGVPWYTLSDLRAEASALRRCIGGKTDIVHFLDPEHGMQYLPFVLSRMPRRPRLVATFHQPPELLPKILRHDVIRHLDHVNLVAPTQVSFFADILPAERISVTLHGIDTDFFTPAVAPPSPEPLVCLTVGHNLRAFEAVRAVAEHFRDRVDIRFVVVTPETTGLEDLPNVQVRRGLSDAGLREAYQQAHVSFLPLRGATANNALLEGFACGCATVTTDLPAIRAYATDDEAILVKSESPGGYIDALDALFRDANRRHTLGAHARRRAESLRWSAVAPAYAALYRQLCER